LQIEVLKIFCDIVGLRSFSEGADANQVSQSRTSQMVHYLEKHLGVKLIDRSHRPWILTPEGKVFYDGCRNLVEQYYELETEVKSFHDEVSSIIRVASIYSVGLRHMSQYIEKFSELYPRVRVHIEYLHPNKVYESVVNQDADIGIVSFPQSKRDLSVIPWRLETMVVACHPEHPLAAEKEVEFSEISGEKFVGFDKDLVIRREIDRFLRRQGVDIEVVLEFDNIEAIKRAVEIASGISILPRPTLDNEVKNGLLALVPFKRQELVRPLGIIHRRGKKFNPNLLHFVELLQSEEERLLQEAVPL
jgi:DNA-binding transcriptional LysR family regulator